MRPIVWIALVLLVLAAVMLGADVGAAGLWIGVTTVGVALVLIDVARHRHHLNS